MTLENFLGLLVIALWLAAIPLFVVIWRGLRRNGAMLKQIKGMGERHDRA